MAANVPKLNFNKVKKGTFTSSFSIFAFSKAGVSVILIGYKTNYY
jgi:triosephosphate isomerase